MLAEWYARGGGRRLPLHGALAPREVVERLEDVDHRHDVSLDAGGEQKESPDDEDRDHGENHAVLGHRLTLFPPANGGEQLGEVGHFAKSPPFVIPGTQSMRTKLRTVECESGTSCGMWAWEFGRMLMVTTMKPPLRSGVTAPPIGSTNCSEHRR